MMRGKGRFPQKKADERDSRSDKAENREEDFTGFCFTCDPGNMSKATCPTVRVAVADSEGFCGSDS
ncbi:MAG: hypothetical protein KAR44_02225 [Candidatus Aegiribacteria sp.]|nr:hypothetical protein [Candidatus Aegiribacteria sp.]